MMTEPLSQRQKFQKLMTEIGGGCYMDNITKGLAVYQVAFILLG